MRSSNLKINTKGFDIGKYRGLLMLSTIILSAMYGYFVLNSVFNITERERIAEQISTIGAKVSVLEANYITMRSAINIDKAIALGFSEDFDNVNFANVAQGDVKGGLSYVNNEI